MPDKVIVKHLRAFFNKNEALHDVSLNFAENRVTAIIGPSGCGKSTLVRCINRMHEVVPGATCTGEVILDGEDIYAPSVDPVQVRRRIGMVFQKPTPFPTMSIEDNVAAGLKLNGINLARADRDRLVEQSLQTIGALGRGQGSSRATGRQLVRWATATPVRRARTRGRARSPPDG